MLYKNAGYQFVEITDSRELPIVLVVFLTFVPVIWSFYFWQLRGIVDTFRKLSITGVIDIFEQSTSLDEFVNNKVSVPCNQTHNFLIALSITIVSVIIWLGSITPDDPFLYGQSAKWWSINLVFMWVIWIPLVFINVYMITWMVIRQAIAINALTHLFQSANITLKVMHPDRCNGLASVGDYAMRSASLVVLLGFWIAFWIISPLLLGLPPLLRFHMVLLLLVYTIAVLALLLPPVWATHLSMSKAKADALESVAVQVRVLLLDTDNEDITASVNLLEDLRKKYQFIEKEYHTWPFRAPAFRRFSIAAIIPPLFSAAASILMERLIK
jgi:hypothetical protein